MRRTPDYLRDQSGAALPAVIILAFIMLIMTSAVFQFGAQDATLAARDVESSQALYLAEAGTQLLGMWGLTRTFRRTFGWALRLMRGRIKRTTTAPTSPIPIRDADGGPASHAPPGTPQRRYSLSVAGDTVKSQAAAMAGQQENANRQDGE